MNNPQPTKPSPIISYDAHELIAYYKQTHPTSRQVNGLYDFLDLCDLEAPVEVVRLCKEPAREYPEFMRWLFSEFGDEFHVHHLW
jgi:hypothetical protein